MQATRKDRHETATKLADGLLRFLHAALGAKAFWNEDGSSRLIERNVEPSLVRFLEGALYAWEDHSRTEREKAMESSLRQLLDSVNKDNKRRSRAGRKGGKKNAGRIKDDHAARKKAIEDARGHLSRHMTQEAAFTTAIKDNGLDITWQALRAAYFKKYPPKNKGGRFK
jgi:general stress protein YciG